MKKKISLAEYYNIPLEKFEEYGILNPNLNKNTKMFIDPVLLKDSKYKLFSNKAYNTYVKKFEDLYIEMKAYIKLPDNLKLKAQKNIINKLTFRGIPYLCLGYSESGDRDKGIGKECARKILANAEELFSLDIDNNPAIFSIVYLLTEKIGPDYISDMTSQIIIEEIKEFTQVMSPKLGLITYKFKGEKYELPKHPYLNSPLLLLPEDILNTLPIDVDIDDIYNGYRPNNEIRDEVSLFIGDIFRKYHEKSNKDILKYNLKVSFKNNPKFLKDFVNYVTNRKSKPYDFKTDKDGFYFLSRFRKEFNLNDVNVESLEILDAIDKIIKKFKDKIDNNNDIKRNLLWINEKPRKEKTWQQAFHLAIFQKLEDVDLDIVPEYQTGSGPIDFTITKGSNTRILIEIKLSKNNPIKGLESQLEEYKKCVGHVKAYFICFNLEKDNDKYNKLSADLNKKKKELGLDTEIIIIDGRINPSASNLN